MAKKRLDIVQEIDLEVLIRERRGQDFFIAAVAGLEKLKEHIRRRMHIEQLIGNGSYGVHTPSDILEEVLVVAYSRYEEKSPDLSFEEWLYQLADKILGERLGENIADDRHRVPFEALERKEERSMEEVATTDGDGEHYLEDELDDPTDEPYREIVVPSDDPTDAMRERPDVAIALSKVSREERAVFELFVMDGFTRDEVANILSMRPEEVTRLAAGVRERVLQEVGELPKPHE